MESRADRRLNNTYDPFSRNTRSTALHRIRSVHPGLDRGGLGLGLAEEFVARRSGPARTAACADVDCGGRVRGGPAGRQLPAPGAPQARRQRGRTAAPAPGSSPCTHAPSVQVAAGHALPRHGLLRLLSAARHGPARLARPQAVPLKPWRNGHRARAWPEGSALCCPARHAPVAVLGIGRRIAVRRPGLGRCRA